MTEGSFRLAGARGGIRRLTEMDAEEERVDEDLEARDITRRLCPHGVVGCIDGSRCR